jgi:hypothetical protein
MAMINLRRVAIGAGIVFCGFTTQAYATLPKDSAAKPLIDDTHFYDMCIHSVAEEDTPDTASAEGHSDTHATPVVSGQPQ